MDAGDDIAPGFRAVSVLGLLVGAVAAGFLSFSSPCCLPLVPGYLSYVSALPVSDLGEKEARGVALRASLLFVGGFTTVFTLLGLGSSALGASLLRNQEPVTRAFGVVIVFLGLAMIGFIRAPWLQRERRVDLARLPRGPAAAFPLGMAFAAGWVVAVGVLFVTGTWQSLFQPLQRWFVDVGWPPI